MENVKSLIVLDHIKLRVQLVRKIFSSAFQYLAEQEEYKKQGPNWQSNDQDWNKPSTGEGFSSPNSRNEIFPGISRKPRSLDYSSLLSLDCPSLLLGDTDTEIFERAQTATRVEHFQKSWPLSQNLEIQTGTWQERSVCALTNEELLVF